LVLPFVLFSCVLRTGDGEEVEPVGPAPEVVESPIVELLPPVIVKAPSGPPAAVEELADEGRPRVVPPDAFPTIDALCRAQELLVLRRLSEAEKVALEQYDVKTHIVPSCHEVPGALAHATIALRPPFHDVRAIEYETGYATQRTLVVRMDDGWRAVQQPALAADHFDPGCPSIIRDLSIREVRVEDETTPALEILVRSARGEGEEITESMTGTPIVRFKSLVFDRARACRLDGGEIRCDAPVAVDVFRTSGSAESVKPSERIFRTSHRIDDEGHVRTAETYVHGAYGPM
jgi:hypothetical protein